MADYAANNSPKQPTAGSWRPGTSGNPSGRPRGSRNRLTVIGEGVLAREGTALLEKAVEMAKAGDVACLKLCIERIVPLARHQPAMTHLDLPTMESARDLPMVTAGLLRALLDGRVALPDILPMLKIIETTATAIATADHDERLAALERLVTEKRLRHGN